MGHQRLSIVDPNSKSADMPFRFEFPVQGSTSSERRVVNVVVNGEIYNHKAVYADLVDNHGWTEPLMSKSDCEVIGHAYACLGGEETAKRLDGMFAFVVVEESANGRPARVFAARDRVGIKPLYYARARDNTGSGVFMFSSELKALVGHADPSTVAAIPSGHYFNPETGLTQYHYAEWLHNENYAPWEAGAVHPTDEEVRVAFDAAVTKRMMADVDYGFLLSGGIDSCIVAHTLMPRYREATGDDRPIPAFTVGMENSPDLMASRALVNALGGQRYIDHRERIFTGADVYDLIPKIIYHMETYEAELIRSAIPNWLLAERAGADVKMVITGEGADELFAGYLYFMDAKSPRAIQNELRRIYGMLGNVNLHRTDRMTMAHGLEARVPFLDTKFSALAMSLDPALKMIDRDSVAQNRKGREKTYLRELFAGPNANGHTIPTPILWRAKAMQCEGVGEDWVSVLQRKVSAQVTDAEMAAAAATYPLNPPHTKEELYYRKIFESHYSGMAHVVTPWEGGCRAAGASWKSSAYTREGLTNNSLLSHALQSKTGPPGSRSFSTMSSERNVGNLSANLVAEGLAMESLSRYGFDHVAALMTTGGDDRIFINSETGKNNYHTAPIPDDESSVFRGSCTCNTPTMRGYQASRALYETQFQNKSGIEVDAVLSDVFAQQRVRIARALGTPEGTEIVIVPSGSDAEYIPIAIAQALNPETLNGKHITNIVTQFREVGAGTSVGAGGDFFNAYAPLVGKLPEQASGLKGFNNVSSVVVDARQRDGTVIDASSAAAELTEEAIRNGNFPIVHGVFGGKTGMLDTVMPASRGEGTESLGVIDACQGRFSTADLQQWLHQDSLVLITGSKFFRAPPFCGAVLIPKNIAARLKAATTANSMKVFGPLSLGAFITEKELPACLDAWKSRLAAPGTNNVGLALRWEAALAEMEALASIGDEEKAAAVSNWAETVSGMIKEEGVIEPWRVNGGIISLRLQNGAGGFLGMEELRNVFRWMSMDVSAHVVRCSSSEQAALRTLCSIGQPVDVADEFGVVRIAIGSDTLADLLSSEEKKKTALAQDKALVVKLATLSRHYTTLKKAAV